MSSRLRAASSGFRRRAERYRRHRTSSPSPAGTRALLDRHARPTLDDNETVLSLIVPAHDEEPLIAATVHALRAAAESTGEPFEILVVDDASTDATALRAREAGARIVPVSLRHIAAVRNAGAAAARGDFFVFADADTIVSPAALREALAAVQAGAVGGGAWSVTFDGRVPWPARVGVWLMLNAFRMTGMAFGCFLFCRREAFTAVGGFDTSLFAAEEVRFSRSMARLGRFVLVRGPVVTSGRKFRTFGALEVARAAVAASFRGTGALRSRDHLPLWYGRRRHEAKHDAGGPRPSS